jgi:deazaflavin-dependent oxidoreductase (nitroreductase family)
MDKEVKQALTTDRLVDISTTGRKTGNPHRIDIIFHFFDERIYLSGMPGRKKDWVVNLLANPEFAFHIKQSFQRDLPALAKTVSDNKMRKKVLAFITSKWDDVQDLEMWVESGTLIEVELT